jgi:hypothetical protein
VGAGGVTVRENGFRSSASGHAPIMEFGLIGLLVVILLIVLIIYFVRRA